jgi:hypothetical protein
MVYVHERMEWEYKLVTHDLAQAPSEEELNALGIERTGEGRLGTDCRALAGRRHVFLLQENKGLNC